MKLSTPYEWEALGLPDVVVVDNHEDDPVRGGLSQ